MRSLAVRPGNSFSTDRTRDGRTPTMARHLRDERFRRAFLPSSVRKPRSRMGRTCDATIGDSPGTVRGERQSRMPSHPPSDAGRRIERRMPRPPPMLPCLQQATATRRPFRCRRANPVHRRTSPIDGTSAPPLPFGESDEGLRRGKKFGGTRRTQPRRRRQEGNSQHERIRRRGNPRHDRRDRARDGA